MADDRWIVVRNWSKFQHYSHRRPVWIKVYIELLDKHEYRQLSLHDRGVLATAWLLYASTDGVLHVNAMMTAWGDHHGNRFGNIMRSLERLNHAGFLDLVASKPLALSHARARAIEKRREEERASAQPQDQPEPKPNAGAYQTPEHADPDPDRLPIADVLAGLASESELAATWVATHASQNSATHNSPNSDQPAWTATEENPF
jgi:hypothetical protein